MAKNTQPKNNRKRAAWLYALSIALMGAILLLDFGLLYNQSITSGIPAEQLLRFAYLLMVAGFLVLGAQGLLIFKAVLASMNRDKTKADELSQRVAQLTVIDDLTKAFNRFKFDSVMGRELENIRRYKSVLSGIMFDIDEFKAINAKHGYTAGDRLLTHLARFVNKKLRKNDYLFRWRGGKFIILTPHVDQAKAALVAEKLRKSIETTPFGEDIDISVSLGVTQAAAQDTMESFLQRLQNNLTSAKNRGRNRVVAANTAMEKPSL